MVEKTILPCGLTVISETYCQFPSLALSYTLKGGSRQEDAAAAGLHHLVEHMLFKGCAKYDLKGIADISDRLGGSLNAFTAKEITQFYIKTVDQQFAQAFELLSQMVMNSTFPAAEFDKEKNVVLQEIRESQDNPDTFAFEVFFECTYPENGLGYPIDGKLESVAGFTRDAVYGAYRAKYSPDSMVLSAVGNISHGEVVEAAARFFSGYPSRQPRPVAFAKASFQAAATTKKNPSLQQNYVIIGLESIAQASPLRHRLMILNHILGAGMSSRLFQKIREEKGLAYTISSFTDSYLDGGILVVYGIIDPRKIGEYLQAVRKEIRLLRDSGISPDELARTKEHILAAIVLSLENNTAKMRFNTSNEIYFGKEQKLEEIIADIQGTQVEDIQGLVRQYLDLDKSALFVYGKVNNKRMPRL